MALTKDRVLGRDVTVTATAAAPGGGSSPLVITDWTEIDANVEYTKQEANAAAATYEQTVLMRLRFTGTVRGFRSQNGAPPNVGDTISAFNIAVASDNVGPTYSSGSYGIIKVIKVNYQFRDQPETWSFDFESGILN
jgi:hypothetical protein